MYPALVPFAEQHQLNNDLDHIPTTSRQCQTLPGQPAVSLRDRSQLIEFLTRDLCAPKLERLVPHLWKVSTQSHDHISPLHRQRVKGREIIITEDPELHLVWICDRIYVKPLPKYLLSYTFWDKYLLDLKSPLGGDRERILCAALGFVRSYFYLIRHESDIRISQSESLCLIPTNVDFECYSRFSAGFSSLTDSRVSGRFRYGELRLTRLNLWNRLGLFRGNFYPVYHSYRDFFAQLYGPMFFVFALIALALNAMQVELSAGALVMAARNDSTESLTLTGLWRWTSLLTLLWIVLFVLVMASAFVFMYTDELLFASKARYLLRKNTQSVGHSSSA
jgi:hypothetical protein